MTPSPVASSSNISPPSLVVYPPVSNEDRASAPLLEPSDLEEGSAAENGDVPEAEEDEWDGMTPLDETLERIGMGRYQKRLLYVPSQVLYCCQEYCGGLMVRVCARSLFLGSCAAVSSRTKPRGDA